MAEWTSNDDIKSSGGGYAKLEEGDNRFRILGKVIAGTEYWVEVPGLGNKPKRVEPGVEVPVKDVVLDKYGKLNIRPFRAMVVWNYKASQIQVLTITQKDVIKGLFQLKEDPDWGNFDGYDVVIKRIQAERTEYTVIAKPHKPLDPEIQKAYLDAAINLDALYVSEENPYGGNPFARTEPKPTQEQLADKGNTEMVEDFI